MNLPGRPSGNWTWRFRWEQVDDWRLDRLANWSDVYGRVPDVDDDAEPALAPPPA